MSGLINKVKDALHKDKGDNPSSDNYGPHGSNFANSADPRVDSDRDGGRNANVIPDTHGSNTAGGYGHNTTGTHVGTGHSSVHDSTTTGGFGSSSHNTAGPHSSNLANRADPRVDSDLDGRNTLGSSTAGGYGTHTTGTHTGGYGANTGVGSGGYGSSNTTAGPHSSNLANRADPRVDSDLDGRGGFGSSNTGGYGAQTTGTHAGGYGSNTGVGSTGAYDSHGSSNAGPHSSNLANKLDPRVDSDRDNRNDPTSRTGGYGTQENYGVSGANPTPGSGHNTHHNVGTTGGYGSTSTSGYGQQTGGPGYGSSGYDNTTGGAYGSSATPGSGNADKTAGPHNSNLLNKLDPRVDSDVDGSKTYGGNQTHR